MEAIPYRLIRSDRKSICLHITPDGQLEVRAPRHLPEARVREFVLSKERWIQKHLQGRVSLPVFTVEELRAFADRAVKMIPERVAYYAPLVGVNYGRITIRNQKTRWGSCSGSGNLNFNCLLVLMPPAVVDYVVIHELCHRKEMNHSSKFWAEVAKVCPNYEESRLWLKKNGNDLIARLP